MDKSKVVEYVVIILQAISIWLTRTNFFAIKSTRKKVDQAHDYTEVIEVLDQKVDTLIAAMKWGIANNEASKRYRPSEENDDLPPSMRIDK